MNAHQKQLVQQSFRQVVPIADKTADLFYNKLFALDPSLRPLFHGDMQQQGLKLMNTLKLAVNALDDVAHILPALQELGRKHVRYGVKTEHYTTVGTSLIWALEQGLGSAFTAEVRAAWVETYGLLSEVMIAAAEEELTMLEVNNQ